MSRHAMAVGFVAVGLAAALLLPLACSQSGQPAAAQDPPALPAIHVAGVTDTGVEFEFTPPSRSGTAEVELYDLTGKMLAKGSRAHDGKPLTLKLDAAINAADPANYYVRYRLADGEPVAQRSLLYMTELLETTVLGQRELVAGTQPVIRVLVRDRSAGRPVAGANVTLTLADGETALHTFAGKTDARGELPVRVALPGREVKSAKLTVEVASRTSKDTINETVSIASATRTLLTTDKPMYQPGQTIHMRALSLNRATMKPLAGADVTFEVEDAKGNKVFRRAAKADPFGVSFADFDLASELNKGTYRIRSIVAGAREEKTVTVDRYVLPKFKVDFKTDRQFYQPGETVKVDLQADYFFGKPVAGGKVAVRCAKFDVAYVEFQAVDGKTDAAGHYAFEVKLPDSFVGQPLEAGKASAKFDIALTDTGDHTEKLTRNVTVTANPVIVAAVPEGGELAPGLENRVYVVTTYADATPAKCTVTVTPPNGEPIAVQTDDAGFGQFSLTPEKAGEVRVQLDAADAKGQSGKATVSLATKTKTDDAILLRVDKSIARVGDKLALSIVSSRKRGPVYVDLIKDRQTQLTRTLELADGKAADSLTLDAGLAGTIQVNAYLIGANGVIVRDRRLVIVDPANDLKVAVSGDAESYLPGGEAKVSFKVTGPGGRGVAAALGVIVVDEAVFALQEMQPGLEKVYFYLEKEIATPRYEIHGYTLDGMFDRPGPEKLIARRDSAARVLLASAKGAGDYTLKVNTFARDDKMAVFQAKMARAIQPRYAKVNEALAKNAAALKAAKKTLAAGVTIAELVKAGYLAEADARDPWGNPLKLVSGSWCNSCQIYHGFVLGSAGIDGVEGTADDLGQLAQWANRWDGRKRMEEMPDIAFAARPQLRGMVADGLPKPMAAAPLGLEPGRLKTEGGKGHGGGGASAEPVRVREYFPETLLFRPLLVTDARGRASLSIPLADSITTWRMTAMANSAAGQLGSTSAGLRVFQDFFVDIDFPVALTQNDQVHVPVVVYNYLKSEQTVRLTVEKAGWFELDGPAEQTVALGPDQVKAVYFPITARKVGFGRFQVTARGRSKSDAIARSVEVAPDGVEQVANFSGRLEGKVAHTVAIPDGAIDGASRILVKVYPGMLSQVVEGLDSMLRMPGGCFEQTSSSTYPNILVLDYMKTTGKITPEIQMKAEGFINAGYQRLVSFEVKGGGFEWFGNPPAHRILTAYGLMEFHDMSKVHDVDPAIIARTQQWLANLQEKDGSFKPGTGGIAEGAINKMQNDTFRTTAYIAWALASTGYSGPQAAAALKYLAGRLDDMKDNYTLALAANAFAVVDPKGKTTAAVLDTLLASRTEDGDAVYWKNAGETPTYGTGAAGDLETTALAVQAFIRGGRDLGTVSKAVTFLARNKDAYGTWQSTQATIQALRAMLMAESGATASSAGTIALTVNGKQVKTLKIDESNGDLLQLVDLKEYAQPGKAEIGLEFEGQGSLLYQIVERHWLPGRRAVAGADAPMSIDLAYDRTDLAAEDIIGVTATVRNHRPMTANMVVVDLGLPPGFTLLADELDARVADKTIEKYSTTGRQIIVYLRSVGQKPVELKYRLLAKYPLKAQTPKSVVYEYYNPKVRAETQPVALAVTKK